MFPLHCGRLCAVLALLLLVLPALPGQAQQPPPAVIQAFFLSPPPVPICPGEQVVLSVMLLDPTTGLPVSGYPVSVQQSAPQAGQASLLTPVAAGGLVSLQYTASDFSTVQGHISDQLSLQAAGSMALLVPPVEVFPCNQYELNLLMKQDNNQDGMALYAMFSGEGQLERSQGQLRGSGTDEVYMSLAGGSNGMVCQLDPSIEGSGTFEASGAFTPLAPRLDQVTLDLSFNPIPVNSASITCEVGDMEASYPLAVGSWNPNEAGLSGLTVILNNGSGSLPVSYQGLQGRITIRRLLFE